MVVGALPPLLEQVPCATKRVMRGCRGLISSHHMYMSTVPQFMRKDMLVVVFAVLHISMPWHCLAFSLHISRCHAQSTVPLAACLPASSLLILELLPCSTALRVTTQTRSSPVAAQHVQGQGWGQGQQQWNGPPPSGQSHYGGADALQGPGRGGYGPPAQQWQQVRTASLDSVVRPSTLCGCTCTACMQTSCSGSKEIWLWHASRGTHTAVLEQAAQPAVPAEVWQSQEHPPYQQQQQQQQAPSYGRVQSQQHHPQAMLMAMPLQYQSLPGQMAQTAYPGFGIPQNAPSLAYGQVPAAVNAAYAGHQPSQPYPGHQSLPPAGNYMQHPGQQAHASMPAGQQMHGGGLTQQGQMRPPQQHLTPTSQQSWAHRQG